MSTLTLYVNGRTDIPIPDAKAVWPEGRHFRSVPEALCFIENQVSPWRIIIHVGVMQRKVYQALDLLKDTSNRITLNGLIGPSVRIHSLKHDHDFTAFLGNVTLVLEG